MTPEYSIRLVAPVRTGAWVSVALLARATIFTGAPKETSPSYVLYTEECKMVSQFQSEQDIA